MFSLHVTKPTKTFSYIDLIATSVLPCATESTRASDTAGCRGSGSVIRTVSFLALLSFFADLSHPLSLCL